MNCDGSILELKGVGEKTAGLFGKLGVFSIRDLVNYFPRSYDIFALPQNISDLKIGEVASVECLVTVRPELLKTKRFTIVKLRVGDPTGAIVLNWYNAPFITTQIKAGTRYIFRGKVSRKGPDIIMAQPAIYSKEAYLRKLKELQPVYPLTKGITNNMIFKLVKEAMPCVLEEQDYLSSADRSRLKLVKYSEAVKSIHFPVSKEACIEAHRRLVFDEFVEFMVSVRNMRENKTLASNGFKINDFSASDALISNLSFELTGAQRKVYEEIKSDLASDHLMSRMIQGDVGSGKTIIAVLALLAVAKAGFQGCIMAPTDVLARQHYESFRELLEPLGIRIALLTGGLTSAQKKKIHAQIAAHECDIVIGTHALIQDSVTYDNLALAVIDEQHRFGVEQREALKSKNSCPPHILAMSATPIPRSLAIILYGDLDISIVSEMPKNRLPIKNCVVGTGYRPTAYNFIRKQVEEGHQAYIICPMVEESDELEVENVIDYSEELKKHYAGSGIVVEYLHGKMKPAEKNAIMERYSNGEIHVLVSTTVIEVGVNVPNATVMMVEDAERFGLAQLHQLRGRVGRGNAQSYCIFIKGSDSPDIEERLNILVKYNDGMKVAEQDLKLRGPGDFFGTRQSGELAFRLADIYGDADVLKLAQDYVNSLPMKQGTKGKEICFSRIQTNNWII